MAEPRHFLIGQRVRISEDARGSHYPDDAHWVAAAEYDPTAGEALYTVVETWPPVIGGEVNSGFRAADLRLWPTKAGSAPTAILSF